MTATEDDLDTLIDAAEVASLLGLAHRNSVSTYRSRYADFPPGQPAPGRGRSMVWRRGEILAWRESFSARRTGEPGAASPRLEELVAATARLMIANPGSEISIRQIAAEAGVAHSDLYRYARSKQQLERLAVERVSAEFAAALPTDFDSLAEGAEQVLRRVAEVRSLLRVLAHEMILDPSARPHGVVSVAGLVPVISEHRQATGRRSEVDAEVVAACLGALTWGITLFGERWRAAMGLAEMPLDQVAMVLRRVMTT